MKKLLLCNVWIVAFGVSLAFGQTLKSDREIGLRSAPLDGESVKLQEYKFRDSAPGESELIERAFTNAPPMIPHDITDLSVTKEDNACVMCHDRKVAKDMGATPVPASHMYDLRAKRQLNKIAESRFNCTACHAPQANAKPLINNSFVADFKSEKDKKRSNLLEVINQGVR
ncbi:nitrate reductase cytochrome c-type subunit [Helicobacter sp. 23-1048]